jgi:hypothetical protein
MTTHDSMSDAREPDDCLNRPLGVSDKAVVLDFELDLDELDRLGLEELEAIRAALDSAVLPDSLASLRLHLEQTIQAATSVRLAL